MIEKEIETIINQKEPFEILFIDKEGKIDTFCVKCGIFDTRGK